MTPILVRRAGDLPPIERKALAGTRVLLFLSPSGHAVQETLVPVAVLREAGVGVHLATWDARAIRFEPVGNLMAFAAPWSTSLRSLWAAWRTGELRHVTPLRNLEDDGLLGGCLRGFDALVIPGGHGPVFAEFLLGEPVRALLRTFAESGRIVGLVCHATAAAGEAGRGREMTCWPRPYERVLGALPLLGDYFAPLGRPAEDFVAAVASRVHTSARPWKMPHAVIDGNLVTAWGPWSARLFALALMNRLAARPAREACPAPEVLS
ncbi:MAG TPA: DJ-1/PfpI family protein [Vicinamibacterales bacterium]|nr:DJ-1/PfpI family protein [Vicinamibacterales bacterium]